MSKRVVDWTSPDVMVWLTKNMNKLTSAESLRVYVQMEAINGETMLGFKKSDCSRFGLIKENDFDKILKKLRSCDEKIEKDLRKNTGRRTKKKPGLFGGDKADSGLDESSSVCEDQGFHREIKVHSDSPGSANTSGTGSFAPSLSGGSSHKGHSGMVAPATYEWEPQPGRTTIPEATYVAPEDIHRIGTFEQVWSPEPEDEVEAPTRAVPRMYPTLPEPEPDWDPDALYENFEPPPPPAVDDRVDEWIDDEQLYLNQEVEGDGVETEDIYENQEFDSSSDGEMEDIYENNEADHSSSEEESSEEEGDNFADISRRLTLAMSVINTVKKESVPVRPPIQPPAAGSFGSSVARRPVEPPAAPVAAKPATPSRDVSSRDVPSGPPAPPSKPKLSSLDQNTSHFLPTTPSPVKGTSGGMSIKEKIALLNSEKSNDYLVQSDAAASVSIKDRQSKIAGLFGASQPTASLPTPPPPTPSPLGLEKKPPLGGRPLIPHGAPTRNPPVGSLPPRRPTPQLPPPSLGPDLPPPPLPSLSCIPQSNTNLSTGCYEDNEITFPIPSPTKGRFPLPPPSMGYNPPNSGVGGYNPTEEDEEGLYDLEPEGPDDIYNDGDEADKIPGYLPHVSSRGTAEELLRNDPQPECFLVRDSTNNPQQYPYVISLKAVGNTFEHTRLGSRSNGKLAIGTAKSMETTHESLADLIHYHRTTPLNLRGRNVLLKYPITPR
ncbi:lymphocyte cytosolic protein 2-like isoform X22 [Bolinopsis microptera]|uniref:lymphocyte cytosolic protein 2-like isoform X22 n=1 Tax=Bolinopsis microptera TaxID=2820187 RepID=UPI00307962AE